MAITSTPVYDEQTPAVTAGAYSDLDVVGGLITFDIVTTSGLFILNRVAIRDKGNQSAIFRLHLYDAIPTTIADNAAYARSDADLAKYLGYVDVSTYDTSGAANGFAQRDDVNNTYKLLTGQLFVYAMLNGNTTTPASTSDLTFIMAGTD